MEVEKIIALHRYALHNKNILYKLALIGHALFLLLFKRYSVKVEEINGSGETKYLFFKALQRFDYDELYSKIVSECKFQKIIVEAKASFGFDFSFLIDFSTKIKTFNKIESRGILDRLYLFTSYLFYNKILKTIDRFDFEILVVFADMQPVDNILVQFYKGRKITTVTLQHGLFVDYEGTYNISSVSYKNVVSDHFLAWGESNKMLIEKHNPDCNVIVCGNPIIKKSYNCVNVRRKFFTIVLDWDVFEKENTEMIGMAMRLADMIRMDFQVRYHPSNDKSKYIINSTFLMQNETLDYMCSEFILGHTSSLIHVAQRLGKKVFKYNTTVPTNPIDKECVVNNESDILCKLSSNFAHSEIKETVNIGSIGDDSLSCYNLFFCNLKTQGLEVKL